MNTTNQGTQGPGEAPGACCANWSECCGCVRIFRSFRVALGPTKLLPAFAGIVATILVGLLLDAVWPAASRPAASENGMTELTYYLRVGDGATAATKSWIDALGAPEEVERTGVFELLFLHARLTINQISNSVVHLDVGGMFDGFRIGVGTLAWLISMHTVYAILFFLIGMAIWGFFGGAISRAAVMDLACDDKIDLKESFAYARARFTSFATAPIIPLCVAAAFAVALWIGGAIGAIPWLGELFVGLFFFLALFAGLVMALALIFGAAGFPLMAPAIAADNVDAWDAVSTAGSYVYNRPWKCAFYALVAVAYGGLCLVLLKLLVALSLWCVGHFAGASMNWGGAYATTDAGENTKLESKLDRMWQAPAPTRDTPFYGTFGEEKLRSVSRFSQLCLKIWIYAVWGLVASFVASFYYSVSSVIYLLIRRDYDRADFEDVYTGEPGSDETASVPDVAAEGAADTGGETPAGADTAGDASDGAS